MKKYLFLSAVVALTLAGCASQEEFDNSLEMTFNAFSLKSQSKALIPTTGLYPKTETFGVFANYLEDQKTWDANYAEAISYFKDEIKYQSSRNPQVWAADKKYYWPAVGSVTFFAYSPYSVDANYETGKGITLSDYAVDQDEDFMVAAPAQDKTMNDNTGRTGVDIVFGHKLSLVDFKIKTKEDYSTDGWTIKVKEIKLSNIYSQGDYQQITASGNDVWSDQSELTSYTFTADDAATGGQEATKTAAVYKSTWRSGTESDALLALPQVIEVDAPNTAKLTVTYTLTQKIGSTTVYQNVVKTKTVDLSNETINEWKVNKKYVYTIIIALDEILFDPSVTNWENPVEDDVEL